jgi:hypothetical protein
LRRSYLLGSVTFPFFSSGLMQTNACHTTLALSILLVVAIVLSPPQTVGNQKA